MEDAPTSVEDVVGDEVPSGVAVPVVHNRHVASRDARDATRATPIVSTREARRMAMRLGTYVEVTAAVVAP